MVQMEEIGMSLVTIIGIRDIKWIGKSRKKLTSIKIQG